MRYGGSEEDWNKPDEQIKQEYIASIKKFFPDLNPVWVKVFREKYSEPVYEKDYIKYMPDVRTPVNGVYMAGIQVTFPKIRNQNTALESGEIAARAVIEDFTGSSKLLQSKEKYISVNSNVYKKDKKEVEAWN